MFVRQFNFYSFTGQDLQSYDIIHGSITFTERTTASDVKCVGDHSAEQGRPEPLWHAARSNFALLPSH